MEATVDPAKPPLQCGLNRKQTSDNEITSHRGITTDGGNYGKHVRKRRTSHTRHTSSGELYLMLIMKEAKYIDFKALHYNI